MSIQNEIINFEFKHQKFALYSKYKNRLDNLFELFHLILKDPFDTFWWEFFTTFFEYFQLLIYITHEKVS